MEEPPSFHLGAPYSMHLLLVPITLTFALGAGPGLPTAPAGVPPVAPLVKNDADRSWVMLRVGGIRAQTDVLRVREALEKLCGRGTVTLQPNLAQANALVEVKTRLLIDGNRMAQECRVMGYAIQLMEVRNGPSTLPAPARPAGSGFPGGFRPGFQNPGGPQGGFTRPHQALFTAWPVRGDQETARLRDALRRVPGLIAVEVQPVPNKPGTVEVRVTSGEAVQPSAMVQAARTVGVQLQAGGGSGNR